MYLKMKNISMQGTIFILHQTNLWLQFSFFHVSWQLYSSSAHFGSVAPRIDTISSDE